MGQLFPPLLYNLLNHPSQAPEGRVNVAAVMFTSLVLLFVLPALMYTSRHADDV